MDAYPAFAVKAEDTTVIKTRRRLEDRDQEEPKVIPVPHEEHNTTVIKKEHD